MSGNSPASDKARAQLASIGAAAMAALALCLLSGAAHAADVLLGTELSSEEYALLNTGAPFRADPFLSSIELGDSNSSESRTLYMIPGLRWQMNRELRVSVGVSVDLAGDPGGFTVLSAIAKKF